MLVLKHVEYEIPDKVQLEQLLDHINKTTSEVDGISFNNIYFTTNKKEFILFLDCVSENTYHQWRDICPPPPGAKDWYELLLTKEEF